MLQQRVMAVQFNMVLLFKIFRTNNSNGFIAQRFKDQSIIN